MTPRMAFERWMKLLAVCVLVLTAFAYPMSFHDELLIRVGQWFHAKGWGDFFEAQMRPIFRFGYHPLVLKETLGALVIFLMFLLYWPWKLMMSPKRKEKVGLHIPLLILIALSGVSLLQTPSFSLSLKTIEAFIPGAIFFLMVSDLDWGKGGRRKLLVALSGIGAVLVLIGFIQITPPLATVYYRYFFKFDDPRNWLPGWIGHNTEMSSYVLSCSIAALALLLTTRKILVKFFLLLMLAGSATVIIAGQSRMIWPLSLLLPAWLVIAARREGTSSIRTFHVFSALAVILLLCLPFAPQLRERVKRYSPSAILEETRTRILFASQDAIREKPLLGHGIGSFASVYPKAQGDYFARHPDSVLSPTEKRTPQAHNEYLQIAVELGLVGLALAMLGIFIYIREGAQGTLLFRDPESRILSLAFGLIAIQHLLNAVVNFPLHVPPSAYLLTLSFAVWVAAGRESTHENSKYFNERELPRSSLVRILLLVLSLLPLAASPLAFKILSRELFASTHFEIGTGLLNGVARPGISFKEKSDLFKQSERHFKSAERLEPLNWEVQYYLAWMDLEDGKNLMRQWQQYKNSTDPKHQAMSGFVARIADLRFAQALRRLEPPFAEVQFHQTFFLKSQIYQELNKRQEGKYEREIRENLDMAVRYSPVYYEALEASLRYYSRPQSFDPQRQRSIAKKMFASNTSRFRTDYRDKAFREFIECDYLASAQNFEFLSRVLPDDNEFKFRTITAYIYAGELERAIPLLAEYERLFGRDGDYWHCLALLRFAQGNDSESLNLARKHGAFETNPSQQMAILATAILEHQNKFAESRSLWNQAFDSIDEFQHRLARIHLSSINSVYGKVVEADAQWFIERGHEMPSVYYLLAKREFEVERFAQAQRHATKAKELGYTTSQALMDLLKRLQEKLQQTTPATLPTAKTPE